MILFRKNQGKICLHPTGWCSSIRKQKELWQMSGIKIGQPGGASDPTSPTPVLWCFAIEPGSFTPSTHQPVQLKAEERHMLTIFLLQRIGFLFITFYSLQNVITHWQKFEAWWLFIMSKEEKNPFGLLHEFIRKVINHINTYIPHSFPYPCISSQLCGYRLWELNNPLISMWKISRLKIISWVWEEAKNQTAVI